MDEHIKNKIEELFNSTPENVSVAWGKKTVDGNYTKENCFVFIVEQKKPLEELNENEILPRSIEVGGLVYKTDVQDNGKIRIVTCPQNVLDECYAWETTPPINQNVIRPLVGGLSISSMNTINYVGTMGIIAVDTEMDAMVGVTNAHVQVGNPLYTNERKIGSEDTEENNPTFQSGEISILDINQDLIGKTIRYVPISLTKTNRTDGALISLAKKDISIVKSFMQCGLSYDLPIPFASTEEIDNLLNTNPKIYSSGRTTGPKETDPCGLMITAIEAIIYVNGYGNNVNNIAKFSNVIEFQREYADCSAPISSGDSGSALIADFDGDWKIIGLIFAGSYKAGYACRIDVVSADLGIIAWDGSPKNYFDVDNIERVTVNGGSGVKTITCNGEKYWQVGSTFEDASCPKTMF